ncbi:hypothetical protein [Brevibacillus sp. SYSU BS000544]|uniref:hypothetical protein n=1 Tax=Brevibacillus sp. SYSU BS000544 TaxID=3416443 RepID=UPI003CE55490
MKKQRGKKRYYKNLWNRVSNFDLALTDDSWFDMWHTHLDRTARGTTGRKPRIQHIKAHFSLHDQFLTQLQSFSKPYQIWLTIHEFDSGQDAVFIHSPNENRDNFPVIFNHVKWGCPVPSFLHGIFDLELYNLGFAESDYDNEKIYFLYLKNGGKPLL